MGWSASWIAVQASKEDVLNQLGLDETSTQMLAGEGKRGDICGSTMPGGWYVVFRNDMQWANRERVMSLSSLGLAVACSFEDRVEMTSIAWAVQDGAELWRVSHDHKGSFYKLDTEGSPPEGLSELRHQAFKLQEEDGGEASDCDYVHDVPFDLARSVCGYRHDECEEPFVALQSPNAATNSGHAPKLGGLLGRLFGRSSGA